MAFKQGKVMFQCIPLIRAFYTWGKEREKEEESNKKEKNKKEK